MAPAGTSTAVNVASANDVSINKQAMAAEREARNTRHAFHETRRLYVELSRRTRDNRIFLPRNLLRSGNRAVQQSQLPSVVYQSGEPDVLWKVVVRNLRCLWCLSSFFQFRDGDELIHHLVTCHGMLSYSLADQSKSQAEKAIIVKVALLRNTQKVPKGEREVALFRTFTFEATLVNNRSCGKRPSVTNTPRDQRPPKRTRLLSARRSTDRPKRADVKNSARPARDSARANGKLIMRDTEHAAHTAPNGRINGSATPRQTTAQHNGSAPPARTQKAARRKTGDKPQKRSKHMEGRQAFKSVQEAATDERLFHSVVQNPLQVNHIGLDDSDGEVADEQEWRSRIRCEEMVEFTDTIPVEQLFMNLWNQFVGMELRVDADQLVAPTCRAFLDKYYTILKRMKLEISFVRHISELHRIGLIDSDDVFQCIRRIGELGEQKDNDVVKCRFLYAEQLIREEEKQKDKQNEKTTTAPMQ